MRLVFSGQSCMNLYLHEAIIVFNEVVLFHKMHYFLRVS